MKNFVPKHSVTIGKHKTSVSLEPCFWEALKAEAHNRHLTISQLIARFDSMGSENLSSSIRCALFLREMP